MGGVCRQYCQIHIHVPLTVSNVTVLTTHIQQVNAYSLLVFYVKNPAYSSSIGRSLKLTARRWS